MMRESERVEKTQNENGVAACRRGWIPLEILWTRTHTGITVGVITLWLTVSFFSIASAQYTDREEPRAQLVAEDYAADTLAQLPPIRIQHYVLEAELFPDAHEIKGKAQIRFEASEEVRTVELELNHNLFPTQLTNEQGETLSAQRTSSDLSVLVRLGQTVSTGQTYTLLFGFEGRLADAQFSPVEGVQLAYIGEEGTYLLYPARWFPLSGYGINRYTAELHITVPSGYQVISGGKAEPPAPAGEEGNKVRYSFSFDKPQFPGSIAVVREPPEEVAAEGYTMKVYFRGERQAMARAYGEAAAGMVSFFSSRLGPPAVGDLSIVEIDDRSLGGYAGPEVMFLASRAIGTQVNTRLLAQEVAQQWWRELVSPATRADLWLDHGLATYSEALYLEHLGGTQALEDRVREMTIEALTHDTVPIRAAGRLEEFSLPYKTLLYDKSAAVLHMLRWVIGDDAFFQLLRQFADQFAFGSATTDDFRKIAEQVSSQNLQGFFLQWMNSTGASDFRLNYTVYRVPNGFKIAGKIEQDLDLFSMPVEVRVETDGEPVTQRVQVTGRASEFSIDTFGRPRDIVLDPNNRVLKYNDRVRVHVAIARGEQAVQRRDYTAALEEYQKALDANRINSLAHYRVGEVFFALRNYQSAANAFREALNGDLDPKWTEVWSHIYLGKIFDLTGQRDRAINEYQQAIRTKDDTQGALAEANKYLSTPYEPTASESDRGSL
ncbi:MAG: peptidase M1 [Acidobacteria bacterium]|nr:peptidase M1 [Acidobacteriota bacterium]